jgi:hypothetical protein
MIYRRNRNALVHVALLGVVAPGCSDEPRRLKPDVDSASQAEVRSRLKS